MAVAGFSGLILVLGTRKGVFLLKNDGQRREWGLEGPFLPGSEVNHATLDPRTGKIYATANDPWFGSRIATSLDLGAIWEEDASRPRFAPATGLTVERIWRIEPGRDSQPGQFYCGVDPATLFSSADSGETWSQNEALVNHPTRDQWYPGAGGLITHSIVLDPLNARRMWIATSAAGVFRSEDDGASWQAMNHKIKSVQAKHDASSELYPEVGQCVHHLVRAPGKGDRLYAQTHWGTYRSDDGAETWVDITDGLPSDFGLVMAAHPKDPDTAYVLPLQADVFRCPPEGKLRVYRTRDAGASWQPLASGLPQDGAYMGTYREAMCTDSLEPAGIYFRTNTGQLYASADEGDTWRRLVSDLPPISSVGAFTID